MRFAIATAWRGRTLSDDVVNTRSVGELLAMEPWGSALTPQQIFDNGYRHNHECEYTQT